MCAVLYKQLFNYWPAGIYTSPSFLSCLFQLSVLNCTLWYQMVILIRALDLSLLELATCLSRFVIGPNQI